MSYDHWKTTEPPCMEQQCEVCGKYTDCRYPMRFTEGKWEEVLKAGNLCDEILASAHWCCYKCCDELEGAK
jgi:hypothetical protein